MGMAVVLVKAQGTWQRRKDAEPARFPAQSPTDLVLKSAPNLHPECKKALKEVVNQIIANKEGFADMPEASAKQIETELAKIKDLP
jgi:hypothetical protein